MKNESYRIRETDLIPIIGMINREERMLNDSDSQNKIYERKRFVRDAALTFYNFTLIGGIGFLSGLSSLAELLNK